MQQLVWSETVVEGETGFLVEIGDVSTFAERLSQLIDDPALREQMGRSGRARAEREFDEDAIVESLADIYDRLLWGKCVTPHLSPPEPR